MLSADDTRLLDCLTLRAAATPQAGGARTAPVRGGGLEFHDYRPYQPGDDVRRIDWNIEARLRQRVVRVATAEGQVPLHVLLDISGSMGIGAPSKHACAARLAASLCYLAAAQRDPLGVSLFADRLVRHVPPAAGRVQLLRVLDTLRTAAPRGHSHAARALPEAAEHLHAPGVAVVLSDFLDAGDADALLALAARRQRPVAVQVLADEDLEPSLSGVTELVDSEGDEPSPLIVDAIAAGDYRARLAALSADLRRRCAQHGFPYLQVRSSAPLDRTLRACLDAGLLALRA